MTNQQVVVVERRYSTSFDDVVAVLAEEMIVSETCSSSLHGYGHRMFWNKVRMNLNECLCWNEKTWTERRVQRLVSRNRTKLFRKLRPLLLVNYPELWTGIPYKFAH